MKYPEGIDEYHYRTVTEKKTKQDGERRETKDIRTAVETQSNSNTVTKIE